MKKIAIEEHFRPKCYINYMLSRKAPPRLEIIEQENKKYIRQWTAEDEFRTTPQDIFEKLFDVGVGRLKEMDMAGIDLQVLSFPHGLEGLEVSEATLLASEVNDEISATIKKYPKRFAGFASLPLKSPSAAADELERAVKQLGFKGAVMVPHVGGEYIDSKQYWPVFHRAAKLGVPIYLHPTFPTPANRQQYAGYRELTGSVWGFAAETGLAAMRLIFSGIFDECPGLKIILGHLGEALPFWLWRLDNRILAESKAIPTKANGKAAYTPLIQVIKKLPSQYIRDNFFVTTSGMLWQPALLCTYQALGAERILFAVDYPNEPMQEAVQFMEMAPIGESDRKKIFHLNAQKLLSL